MPPVTAMITHAAGLAMAATAAAARRLASAARAAKARTAARRVTVGVRMMQVITTTFRAMAPRATRVATVHLVLHAEACTSLAMSL